MLLGTAGQKNRLLNANPVTVSQTTWPVASVCAFASRSCLPNSVSLPCRARASLKCSITQVVSGMLYLQASAAGDPALSERLNEASTRISTVGRAMSASPTMLTMRVSVLPRTCGRSLLTWRLQLLPVKYN